MFRWGEGGLGQGRWWLICWDSDSLPCPESSQDNDNKIYNSIGALTGTSLEHVFINFLADVIVVLFTGNPEMIRPPVKPLSTLVSRTTSTASRVHIINYAPRKLTLYNDRAHCKCNAITTTQGGPCKKNNIATVEEGVGDLLLSSHRISLN